MTPEWPEDEEIFEPTEDDRDPDAEREMQQSCADAMFDPWFRDAEHAQTWEG